MDVAAIVIQNALRCHWARREAARVLVMALAKSEQLDDLSVAATEVKDSNKESPSEIPRIVEQKKKKMAEDDLRVLPRRDETQRRLTQHRRRSDAGRPLRSGDGPTREEMEMFSIRTTTTSPSSSLSSSTSTTVKTASAASRRRASMPNIRHVSAPDSPLPLKFESKDKENNIKQQQEFSSSIPSSRQSIDAEIEGNPKAAFVKPLHAEMNEMEKEQVKMIRKRLNKPTWKIVGGTILYACCCCWMCAAATE